ncbi:MAG: hypothetical protein GXO62_03395 [Epsilonproteobacteria bacterium]|nr:hypothetical protein [Campylobacterota bacterium]
MILKYIAVLLLSISGILLYMADNYVNKQNYYLQKDLRSYSKLISELHKIQTVNMLIQKSNIPVFSKNEAKNNILNTIDSLKKVLPIEVLSYDYKNSSIQTKISLNTSIKTEKEKRAFLDLFKTKTPIIIYHYVDIANNRVNALLTITLPYKDERESK